MIVTKDRAVKEILDTITQILEKHQGYEKLDELIFKYYKDVHVSNAVLNSPIVRLNFSKLNFLMQAYERDYEDDFAREFMNYEEKKPQNILTDIREWLSLKERWLN
jgi:hypothetical protein